MILLEKHTKLNFSLNNYKAQRGFSNHTDCSSQRLCVLLMLGKGKHCASMPMDETGGTDSCLNLEHWAWHSIHKVCKQANALKTRWISSVKSIFLQNICAQDMCFLARHAIRLFKLLWRLIEHFFMNEKIALCAGQNWVSVSRIHFAVVLVALIFVQQFNRKME